MVRMLFLLFWSQMCIRDRVIHRSMAFISWNFQLSPRAAAWYSPPERAEVCVCSLSSNIGRFSSLQMRSFWRRSFSSSFCDTWSFRPSSMLTLLMMRWEWICSRSTWVQMCIRDSLCFHTWADIQRRIDSLCYYIILSFVRCDHWWPYFDLCFPLYIRSLLLTM